MALFASLLLEIFAFFNNSILLTLNKLSSENIFPDGKKITRIRRIFLKISFKAKYHFC